MPTLDTLNPVQAYAHRAASADVAAGHAAWRARWLSWLRLATALVALLAVVAMVRGDARLLSAKIVGAVSFLIFSALVHQHRRASALVERERETAHACRAGIARCQRDWSGIPPMRTDGMTATRNVVARDLDLFGDVSLFRLLDVSAPALGGTRVLEWLLSDPAAAEVIAERQRSVSVLRERPQFLLESARLGRHAAFAHRAVADHALTAFVRWCETATLEAAPSPARSRVAMALSGILLALVVGQPRDATPLIIACMMAQLALATAARRRLDATHSGVGALLTQLRGVDASMQLIVGQADVPGVFGWLQARLRHDGAAGALARLDTILRWNDVRLTPLAHWALNAIAGVDVHILRAFERWRWRHGVHMSAWVDHTSTAQALTALATMAYENPTWAMPAVHDDGAAPAFVADEMTHPLLSPITAVPNVALIEGRGSLLVLSGSNMAGKTTYLRAVGVNALLALAGGAVAATRMAMQRTRIRTTIRIQDDLGSGVSLFLAEVSRLRDVVQDVEECGGLPVLFLFDEILHGTNAADRRYASTVILRRLLRQTSWGLVTTHDTDLVTALREASGSDPVLCLAEGHFRETVQRHEGTPHMSFDYLLRPGPASSANAKLILESMGLYSPLS